MSGDLGAGKTTLVRGLARGLGVRFGVRSPSFAIHLAYGGRLPLHHVDLHRVLDPRDLDELEIDDLLAGGPGAGVCVVEWGERLGARAPADAVRVTIVDEGGDARSISVQGPWAPVRRLEGSGGGLP